MQPTPSECSDPSKLARSGGTGSFQVYAMGIVLVRRTSSNRQASKPMRTTGWKSMSSGSHRRDGDHRPSPQALSRPPDVKLARLGHAPKAKSITSSPLVTPEPPHEGDQVKQRPPPGCSFSWPVPHRKANGCGPCKGLDMALTQL